jgi:hypothetical protein
LVDVVGMMREIIFFCDTIYRPIIFDNSADDDDDDDDEVCSIVTIPTERGDDDDDDGIRCIVAFGPYICANRSEEEFIPSPNIT